ncbi:exosortase B [Piscinibacter sp.]|jgi:exosortase B|uniref:exosortase B n=1 Tax=Piscinibacter sp. TaxID=1903157 RepID=UPI001B649B6C|nr:exosortase B [Piscinibacter sp.]MBK7531120.1 exosortase B [Piscinibacter sp.]MBP6542392.1 exosortase B [Piscinibacter sp.]
MSDWAAPRRAEWLGIDPAVVLTLLAGMLAMAVPLVWDWSHGTWDMQTQGHEPLILAISAWLVYRQREALAALQSPAAPRAGAALFVVALMAYICGRLLGVFRLELVSMMMLPAALLLYFRGFAALRLVWFAFFFLIFAIPLPFALVLAVTGPMKAAVSALAAQLLSLAGYPIGLSGVVITIGQYQLLVNEACAGLQTMFTLEAMGLLYASLMNHSSALRNTLLAVLVVPIAFCANVVRVMVLALVTYHLGDAAGQGFLHGFAGMVLFVVALVLVMGADALLGRLLAAREVAR